MQFSEDTINFTRHDFATNYTRYFFFYLLDGMSFTIRKEISDCCFYLFHIIKYGFAATIYHIKHLLLYHTRRHCSKS